MVEKSKGKLKEKIIYILIGTCCLLSGAWISPLNHYLAGILIMITAILLYFYIVLAVVEKNWLDIRAIFTGIWLFTIGLSQLHLVDYQEQWVTMTWVNNALAYSMFQMGACLGGTIWKRIVVRVARIKFKYLSFKLHENRLFNMCVVVTLVSIICFIKNVQIRGYIPFFSSDVNAYVTFHTVYNLFSMAAIVISSLCYYCIVTQKIALWKKIVLGLCIVYATFIYPILILSRGIFVTAALILATTIFYLHQRRFFVLVTSVLLIFGIYVSLSSFRGYTEAQLDYFFEPSEITISDKSSSEIKESQNQISSESTGDEMQEQDNAETLSTESQDKTDVVEDVESGETVFVIPTKIAFLYSYLTVSHDNFNEAVQNSTEYTYGLRQLSPLNVKPFNLIFDFSAVNKAMGGEYYLVRPHLNTINLIGNFYYDLHSFGVAFFMLLWGCVFAIIQACCVEKKGPFGIMQLGITMTPVILSFFASWMNVFQHWVFWGTGWILWFVAYVHLELKGEKN